MIIESLETQYLADAMRASQKTRSPFRASALGYCTRKLAYQHLGVQGEALRPRRWAVLRHGTFTHEALTADLVLALGPRYLSPADLGDLKCEIEGQEITFHPDGAFQAEDGRIGIVEIKTMADYSFRRACEGEIDREYLCQAWVYHAGTSFNPVVFLAYRKETSHMVEIVFDSECAEKVVTQRLGGDAVEMAREEPIMISEVRSPFDPSVEAEVCGRIRAVAKATVDSLPDGVWKTEPELVKVQGKEKAQPLMEKYGTPVEQKGAWFSFATGRTCLGWPCNYCDFKRRCYPQSTLEIIGGKPVHVTP